MTFYYNIPEIMTNQSVSGNFDIVYAVSIYATSLAYFLATPTLCGYL